MTEAAQSETESRLGRRQFLTGALTGVVGSALIRLPQAQAQGLVEFLELGNLNLSQATTRLRQIDGTGPALQVVGPDSGSAIRAISNKGLPAEPALEGHSPGTGVHGMSSSMVFTQTQTLDMGISGLQGTGDKVGVVGTITSGPITITEPSAPIGVWGLSPAPKFNPVTLTLPAGVVGTASGPGGVAMVAHNPTGPALSVIGDLTVTGEAVFTCGGTGVFPSGQRKVEIEDSGIREGSLVIVVLTSDSGNRGVALHHVDVGAGKAVAHLTARVREETSFTYLCLGINSR